MSAKTKQLPMGSVLLLFLLLFCCVAFATGIRQEMLDAAVRCFTVVIPSLYAMMILTQLLTATEIWRILGSRFAGLHRISFTCQRAVLLCFC